MLVGNLQLSAQVEKPEAPPAVPGIIRMFIADDHPTFRAGIRLLTGAIPSLFLCGEASDGPTALEELRRLCPAFAILDVNLPGLDGVHILEQIMKEQPGLRVLMVSLHDENLYALRCVRAGACGYVMKKESTEVLLAAIEATSQGLLYLSAPFRERLIVQAIRSEKSTPAFPLVETLSRREREILALLGQGLNATAIAQQLNISFKTVESHRSNLKQKLNFSRLQALIDFASAWVQLSATTVDEAPPGK